MKYRMLMGLLWTVFISRLAKKKFAEVQKSLEKILEKMWHFFVMILSPGADDEALTTIASKQTTNVKYF